MNPLDAVEQEKIFAKKVSSNPLEAVPLKSNTTTMVPSTTLKIRPKVIVINQSVFISRKSLKIRSLLSALIPTTLLLLYDFDLLLSSLPST